MGVLLACELTELVLQLKQETVSIHVLILLSGVLADDVFFEVCDTLKNLLLSYNQVLFRDLLQDFGTLFVFIGKQVLSILVSGLADLQVGIYIVVAELGADVVNGATDFSSDFTHFVKRRESLELRVMRKVDFINFFLVFIAICALFAVLLGAVHRVAFIVLTFLSVIVHVTHHVVLHTFVAVGGGSFHLGI